MVERRAAPSGRRMTCLALLTERQRDMVGILRLLVVSLVALITALERDLIVIVDMARCTTL